MERDEELWKVVHSLSATVKSLAQTTERLSENLVAAQEELAGLRLVSQAAFGALGDSSEGSALFPAAIARVMEADTAHMLTTAVSDQAQERRRAWMLRLLPPYVLLAVQQIQQPPQSPGRTPGAPSAN